MTRLTVKNPKNNSYTYNLSRKYDATYSVTTYGELEAAILDKLGRYEDLEEQGYLHIYPLLPGQTFWELNTVHEEPTIYPRIAHSHSHCEYVRKNFNNTCFLSEQDAQAALNKYLNTTKE